MSGTIKIEPAAGKWVVRAAGAVLGETTGALALTEGSYPTVYYIPRGDVSMAFFDTSDTKTTCPHKGEASYFDLQAKSGTFKDAAWSYEDPKDDVAEIKGYLAFDLDKVAVEQI